MNAKQLIEAQDTVQKRVMRAAQAKADREGRDLRIGDVTDTICEYMGQLEALLSLNQHAIQQLMEPKSKIVKP